MLWACILLPQLALDGVLRTRSDADAPLALLTGTSQRRTLKVMNPAARALGLKPGQTLRAALALTNDFATAEYDLTEIDRSLQLLAAWAYGFSSQVSLRYPRCLLMEVGASLDLFGPWPRFEARLRQELDTLGFRHRITAAPNPAAARALANSHERLAVTEDTSLRAALEALPIAHCGLSPEATTGLIRMGIKNLKHLLSMSRDSLARRFPAEVLVQLDTLLGHRALALDFYSPPDLFDARVELNFEVTSHQALLFPLHRLIGDLAIYLTARDSGVQQFDLILEHRDRSETRVPVGLLNAEREPGMLLEVTRGRLEHLQLPSPVLALRLVARDLPAFTPTARRLFDKRPQQSLSRDQLCERLRARLGDDAVQSVAALADHRPECSGLFQPIGQTGHDEQIAALPETGPRPAWLLPKPIPLNESSIRILSGPERIESGWWDGDDIRRDYYQIETRKGQVGWAYRDLRGDGRLYLHGWFS